MQLKDWLDWQKNSMERFWFWSNTQVIPKKVGPEGGWAMYYLTIVLNTEWEIQEYDAT